MQLHIDGLYYSHIVLRGEDVMSETFKDLVQRGKTGDQCQRVSNHKSCAVTLHLDTRLQNINVDMIRSAIPTPITRVFTYLALHAAQLIAEVTVDFKKLLYFGL